MALHYTSTFTRASKLVLLLFLALCAASHPSQPFCRYPDLSSYSSHTHYEPADLPSLNYNCKGNPFIFTSTINNGILEVINCTSEAQYTTSRSSPYLKYTSPVTLRYNEHYALVKCGDSSPMLVIRTPDIPPATIKKVEDPSKTNIFVVMLDAISHEVFKRMMPQTRHFLSSHKKHNVFEFKQFATVGLNSNPNKFALMGRNKHYMVEDHFKATGEIKSSFIWEYAKKQGYLTFVAEDFCPKNDLWNLMKINPLSIYGNSTVSPYSPDFLLLDQMCTDTPHPNKYCLHGQWGYEYVTEYASKFLPQVEDSGRNVFMWTNFVEAHEPEQHGAKLMDEDVVKYLQMILDSPLMDNGVLMVLSDHGLHFGEYGYSSMMGLTENRHPFLWMVTGRGMGQGICDEDGCHNSFNMDILNANKDRLVTPYDLYTAMVTLIGGPETGAPLDPRDFDVINKYIPLGRTCEMADVPKEFCICNYGPATCDTAGIPSYIWHKCQSQYIHPFLFDWKYYSEQVLKPKFGGDFSECESIRHWCAFGFMLGWNGTGGFGLRHMVAADPTYEDGRFCYNWPTDCNWANIVEHYFVEGFLKVPDSVYDSNKLSHSIFSHHFDSSRSNQP